MIQPILYDMIQTIRNYLAANTIWSSGRYYTIHRMIRYYPASPLIRKTHLRPILGCLRCLSIQILYHISCWCPLIWFFNLPRGLCRQTFALFLCCCIFCCLLCFQFRWRRLQCRFFGLSNCKYNRAIFWSNSWVLDGATPEPLLLIFLVDCSWWVLVPITCLWELFETLCLEYSPPQFSLQACYCIFVFWSLSACGRLSVAWRRIVDSMACSSWRWVFLYLHAH